MNDIGAGARFIVTLVLCCICYFPMNNFRFSKKFTNLCLWTFTGIIITLNMFLIIVTGNETLSGLLLFSVGIPYFVLILLLSKGPAAQRIFNFWLWINVYLMLMTLIAICKYFFVKNYTLEILVIIILFSTYYFLYHSFLKEKHHRIMHELKINWWIVSIIPVLFTVTFRNICVLPGALSQNPQNIPKAIMLNLLMLSVYALMFYTFKTATETAEKEQAAQDLEMQLALQKQHYKEMADKNQEGIIFRHDARHRNMLLLSLAKNQELDKIKELLQKDIASISQLSEKVYTVNSMLNAVLTEHISRAEKKGLTVKSDIKFSKSLVIDETTLCVMLSNLLENAVYAGKSFLEIAIKQNKNQLCISIKNDYSEKTVCDEHGNYISTKQAGSGFGLKSVRFALEKSGGFLRVEDDGTIFNVFASIKNQ